MGISNATTGIISGGGVLSSGLTTLVNAGKVQGQTTANGHYGAINLQTGGIITNLATGTISGENGTYGVRIKGAAGTVINAGYISNGSSGGDAVTLAAGYTNLVVVDPGAKFKGIVDGGGAAGTTLELGSGAAKGTLSGFGSEYIGFGTLTLDPSASWLIEASTSITVPVIDGFAAGDTIDVAGFVAVSRTFASNTLTLTNGGGGHEILQLQGAFSTTNFTIASDGSGGTDITFGTGSVTPLAYGQTIDQAGIVATAETVTAGTMTLFDGASPVGTVAVGTSLSSGDFLLRSDGAGGTDVIVDTVFGTYASGVTLLINPTTIAATAKVTRSIDDASAVTGPSGTAWTLTNQGLVSETGAGGDGVSFASAGTVINTGSGTIAGSGSGILLNTGGSVTNQSGGTISGYYGIAALNAAATVVNAGVIAGFYANNNADGVYLQAGGSVTNQAGGTISGYYNGIRIAGARGTVVNLGTVDTANRGAGIYLANGGVVTNGASGGTASTAYILGYHYGVKFGASAAGTLTNFGTISGNPGSPAVTLTTGTIINGPSGATGALIEGGLQTDAILIGGVGTVVNYGTIQSTELSGDTAVYYGVRLGGTAGSISNLGTNALIENYLGVYATMNDTVTNAGTIASNYVGGRDALVFGGGTNRLIVDPGARFIGTVSGSGPVTVAPYGNTQVIGITNGIGSTTLELASASGAGTLHGLGVQYVGFGQVTVDSGANWTLAGANTLAAGETLTNAGTLTDGGTLTNAGRITAAAKGIVLTTGAHLTNQSGGTIATGGIAVAASGAATVVNAGLISGNPTLTGGNGVYLAAGGSVTDQSGGTISGDIAIYAKNAAATLTNAGSITGSTLSNGDGVAFRAGGSVSNQSGGIISGHYGIYFATGATATLTNAGRIFGNTSNPTGAGVFVGGGGTFTNLSGGTIIGQIGVYAENVAATVVNAGSIGGNASGGAGVYLEFGGSVTNQSGGTISGGADAVKFAAGHTGRLVIDPGATFTGSVDGGNTIGAASISTLELASGAGTGTLSGLGTQFIDFARVTVDANAAWTLTGTQSGFATLANAGDLTGGVTLGAGGLTVSNQSGGTIAGTTGLYALGTVIVANAGSIAGNVTTGSGIVLTAGGSLTNQAGGTISGSYGVKALSVAATVVNAGSIGDGSALSTGAGIALKAGGSITNQSGGEIIAGLQAIYTGGAAATVINAGSIGGGAATGNGVIMVAGGLVSNQSGGMITGRYGVHAVATAATVSNDGSIGGNLTTGGGIDLSAGGTVTNQSGGTISGLRGVIVTGGIVVNDGGIAGNATASTGAGVLLADGGPVTNQAGGTITGYTGVYGQAAATVVNAGSIGGNTASGRGIYLKAGGTITNQAGGTISGGADAVLFAASFSNRLVVDPGAAFIGTVDGGDVPGSMVSTLELASGASAGTLTGLGTQFIGFADITIDAGATWTLSGSNTVVAGTTLTNDGTLTDTGTLFNNGTMTGNRIGLSGGALTNQAGGVLTATYVYGIAAGGADTVANHGTVTSATNVAIYLKAPGSVSNAAGGTISGYTDGVRLSGTVANLTNLGQITAAGAVSGDYGVEISGSGSVSNLGPASLIEGYGGVQIGSGGTITNAGTIESNQGTAGVAVAFAGGNARLIDDPGAVFIGSINGGTGGTAVLELASAGSAGILTGLGTEVTNFTSLVFDTGSAWTVAGDDSANGLGTLGIGGFTINDTIDLTGFVATSRTFAGSTLTLTAAGGAHETLTFQGSFATGNFAISSDGNGGTDVTYIIVPQIAGTAAGQAVTDEATIHPFSGVTISDANTGSQAETVTITLTNNGTVTGADGTLSGAGLTETSAGIYTLSAASAGAITTALEALVFTPTAHQVAPAGTVTTGFTIQVTDTAGGTGSNSTTTVIATAANDPPVITGAIAGQSTNDETTIKPLSGVSVSDVDFGQTETVTVTLSSPVNGTLSDVDGGTFNSGTSVYSITGTDGAVSTALEALVFTPTAHQVAPGSSVTTTFTIQATDTAGNTSSDSTTTVGVTAAIDPPVISGAVAGQTTTDEATITPFFGVTINDVDLGQTETVTVTLSNHANGTLSNLDGGSFNGATGVYSVSGTDGAVTTALEALVFTPTAHQVAPGSTVTTTFTIQATDTAGGTSSNSTTTVGVTAVNDPPVISGTVAGQITTDEAAITPLSGVSVSDVDFGQTETVTVTLSAAANGTLSDVDGGSFDSGTGVYSITGTDGAVSTALDALVFTPTAHQVAPGSSVTTTFTIQATDTAGGTSSNSTTTVGVTAANDPPVISGTVAGQTTTDEATVTPFSDASINDPDVGASETVTITLTAGGLPSDANGILSGAGLSKTGIGTYTLTAGTPAAVSAALQALVFTPTAHEVAPGETVTTGMTLSVSDGIVGSPTTDTTTSVVTTAANDPPVIAGTAAGQLINDDQTDRPFAGVTISDPDVGASETVTITLNAGGVPSDANGILSSAGLTKTGVGTYTLAAGTPAAVTAALRALVFTPAVFDLAPDSSVVTDMTLSVSDGIAGSPTTDTTTSVAIVPCFAAGTRIATPSGAIPVERLRESDMVLTVSGKPQPIQWIGRRTLDCNRHLSPERVKPIRIAPHAFGENRPRRALLLSPDHSVFVEEVLIPVKHLVNGTTVTQIDVAIVTYYHIELPRHDVLLAEGLPAETYLETGGRFAFENGGGAMELHPDFAPDEARVGMVWRNFSYAPLIGADGQLERVRARLALQALMLDHQANAAPQRAKKRARR